ncbi:MAG: HAMP domain-containing histidine kinase [Tannerellaceae bacterium]|jgi:signal transduction histidine kinase|nr:HAMP domain-containing histidine kinase [Tannerellaceae bacterium]
MIKLSLQNRIVFNFIVSTAILASILCIIILFVISAHTNLQGEGLTEAGREYVFTTILFRVCIVGFFFILGLLFLISRMIAQNSVKPVREIINISNTITHNNLSARIPLPDHKDELYELSATINSLLDRIELAMEREKSFTSYASHEFRTPLSVLKGTMEVLIRRPRTEEEYRERITACIREVDKLNEMVEQLLILSRHEESGHLLAYAFHRVKNLLDANLSLFADQIRDKKIDARISVVPGDISIHTDKYSMSIILKNLLSNAVKYTDEGGSIECRVYGNPSETCIEIANTGHGIPEGEQEKVFEKFYRAYTSASSAPSPTKSFGLGLPIVKRFCTLLNIDITITSEPGKETIVTLKIPAGGFLSKS